MIACSVLPRLFALYRRQAGIEIVSGLNPYHFNNYRDAPFTRFLRDGSNLTIHLGISIWEVLMLQDFCAALRPRSIFIVGNGLGWSALALALINPQARVLVVEPETGIELTNQIAEAEGLDCKVVRGRSPDDTRRAIETHGNGRPDFVLIDGLHEVDSVMRDFGAVFEISGKDCWYFFHDVINFRLQPALTAIGGIAEGAGMRSALLQTAPSGMAVVYPAPPPDMLRDLLRVYSCSPEGISAVAELAGSTVP